MGALLEHFGSPDPGHDDPLDCEGVMADAMALFQQKQDAWEDVEEEFE